MKVLLVDDDAGMRRLVQRVLIDKFSATVVEADDGVAALEYLSHDSVDLVVCDLSMRVIGGLEMLETIRRSSRHSALPVVLVTGNADENGVRQAVKLGVTEVIAKPFTIAGLRERLTRVVAGLSPQEQPSGRRQPIELGDDDTALVVDASPEFRALARQEIGRLCRVEEAPNEFSAITRAMSGGVRLIVIGEVSELSSLEHIGKKLRSLPKLRDVRLMTAVAAGSHEDDLGGVYDAVVARSFVPETFRASLEKTLGPQSLGTLLLQASSPCLDELGGRIGSIIGDLLDEPVAVHREPPGLPADSRVVQTAIELQGSHSAWDFRVTCSTHAVLHMATRLLSQPVDKLPESAPVEALGLLCSDLAGQLQELVGARGLQIDVMSPRVVTARESTEQTPHGPRLWRCYLAGGGKELATIEIERLRRG